MSDSLQIPQDSAGATTPWSEVRLTGKLPERRSNHLSFIVNDYLYIHGGRDIKEGPMANMWKLSLQNLSELLEDSDYGVSWEPVTFKGTTPGYISHHKAAVFGHSVAVFGGVNDYDNSQHAYEFDSHQLKWSKLNQSGDVPQPRDDHSLSPIDATSFLIFGGFVAGSRVNECYIGKKNGNTLEWKQIGQNSPQKPCIRASHSTVVYQNKCYIFGGQDDENNKLNDLWCLDLATETYSQIELPELSHQPQPRSGHTANVYNGKMYIFGGIFELTKELNEMLIYDFASGLMQLVSGGDFQQELNQLSQLKPKEEESPALKKGMSPTKVGNQYGSPTKTGSKSPSKLTAKARKAGKSPHKKDGEEKSKKETGLASPTSISMQNTFIIKNADDSFDLYYQQMKKRRLGQANANNQDQITMGGLSAALPQGVQENHFGVVKGIQPAARDGHTVEISEDGLMLVFGGDRHHMSFNDLYLIKLPEL